MTVSDASDVAERGREHLVALQEHVRTGTQHVAEEGDRWFLAALRGIDQGLRWSRSGAVVVGGRVADGWERLRATLPRRPARRRLQDALVKEARGSSVDPEDPAFQTFAENMATLLELVLAGAIRLEDVGFAFEGAPTDEDAATSSEETSP